MTRKPLLVLKVETLIDDEKLALYNQGFEVGMTWYPKPFDLGALVAGKQAANVWMR